MKHLFCWQLILIFLYLTSAWMFFFHTLATAFPTSWHIKTFCSCLVWKASNNSSLLNIVSSVSLLTQSDWMEKKANQSFCIRKKAWEQGWCPQRRWQDVKLSAMCKCVQKRSALLKWGLLIWKIQPLVYRKKIDVNLRAQLFIIQPALLDCSFPILGCYSRLSFQIVEVKFSDCWHSAHELCQRHILPSVALVKQQVYVVS